MKPGWKTTEFWQTMIAQALGFLAFAGVISANDSKTMEEALGKSAAAVFTLIVNGLIVISYVRARFQLKTLGGETPRKLTVLILFAGLGSCLMGAPAQAQMLPWRQSITQQLRQHESLLNNLKNAPAPQIIMAPPATPPLQSFPIAGGPQQSFPIQGQPQQSFPIQGQPQLQFPIQGQPKQDFPLQGQPQPLPSAPPNGPQNGPQAYSRQYALHQPMN